MHGADIIYLILFLDKIWKPSRVHVCTVCLCKQITDVKTFSFRWKNKLLILFPIKCSIKRDSLYTALLYLKAEVSKVGYSSKAVGSNVRGVGTFFDTCANLGQFSLYDFKNCILILPKVQSKNSCHYDILRNFLRSVLVSGWNLSKWACWNVKIVNFEKTLFFLTHKYSNVCLIII